MRRAQLFIFLPLIILIHSCIQGEKKSVTTPPEPLWLTIKQANNLAELPMDCMQTTYPNKLGQILGSKEELGEPHMLHPAFFGCYDWHSSVHGHWSLVRLLKLFPELDQREEIRRRLIKNISETNILTESEYFQGEHAGSYERTYGWGWLLKLAEELHTWDDSLARELETNLQPLTQLIVERYIDFLPKLNYPIRVGEHTNTAFGLCFAWDYASTLQHEELKAGIRERAMEFYGHDRGCPIDWEPSGYDFLSPCLEEIDLMRRIMNRDEFIGWMDQFLPQLLSEDFMLEPGEVSDRTDGKLVHLDGLNFSRAWVFYGLAAQYPEYSHLVELANTHVNHSLPNLVGDDYEGGHWLGSFAIYALTDCAK